MGDQWHYSRGGKQGGPVSAAELKHLVASGQLSPNDMVWREGMAAWAPASSVKGLFNSASAPPSVAPPAFHSSPPAASRGSETGTCAFCRKPMPIDALQCSSCQNWRRDIHVLIDTYRKFALAQVAATMIGGLVIIFLVVTTKEAETWTGQFSFEKFRATSSFVLAVITVILVVVVWIVTQVSAVGYRQRIQQATNGLWKRPWWTFQMVGLNQPLHLGPIIPLAALSRLCNN